MADTSVSNKDFNVFIGTETGILKGININTNAVIHKNFHSFKALERGHEITAMAWGDEEQREIVMGLRDQTIRVFDSNDNAFISARKNVVGEGPIVSVVRWDGITVTAVKSGEVTAWRGKDSVHWKALQKSGEFLCTMKQSPTDSRILAVGGKESDLQLWDLEHPQEPVFSAKNVRPDMLQLRVPIWVTDISFMSDKRSLAVISRHCHVRLYDPQRQKRPTLDFVWEDSPLTCMAAVQQGNHEVVVGTAHGCMGHFDLRGRKPAEPVCVYKGFAGAVRNICVHPTQPLVLSASLDRFMRVHHLQSRKLLQREYLKSRLNCLLVRNELTLDNLPSMEAMTSNRKRKVNQEPSEEGQYDSLDWDELPKVGRRMAREKLKESKLFCN